jgi:spermidine synthase
MSHIFLERRGERLRLYLNGDLQFDSDDEHRYHEPLAALPTAVAGHRAAGRDLRVLVLGGGDGLALREVLRAPRVREVHLVDRDPEVLRLGDTVFAPLNHGALRDPRVRVHVRDARDYLPRARGFDVVISDLTYPGDVGAAGLFSVAAFRRVRTALAPGGIFALNAVSPEETPQAFGCVGATLAAAGLAAVPYALAVPSFLEEGYGRWGFFFAAPRTIGAHELRRASAAAATRLTPAAMLDGLRFPATARRAMRAGANATSELLYYLYNPTPLVWAPPFRALHLAAPGRTGPRLTVAQGFARWLRAPAGRRSLEELLACLPLSWRGQTREALFEWSHQAELIFRELDLRAFVARALRRAGDLPPAWVRELRRLRDALRRGLPPLGELLQHAYRVFAVYLLVLLLVNLFFPDNLYAKGFSSSSSSSHRSYSSGSSSSGSSEPFSGFAFTDPMQARFFRARPAFVRSTSSAVYDPKGRSYSPFPTFLPALAVGAAAAAGSQTVKPVLALTPELQLLDNGGVACGPPLPGYQCLLEPGQIRVIDASGAEVTRLLPPGSLETEATTRTREQVSLIDQAVQDHRRWLDWVGWASSMAPGLDAKSEMTSLDGMRGALQTAGKAWEPAGRAARPAFEPPARWVMLFPGLYLEPPAFAAQEPTVVWVDPDGTQRRQSVQPPATLGAADRFLFRALERRLVQGKDQSLSQPVARWREVHGTALGPPLRA